MPAFIVGALLVAALLARSIRGYMGAAVATTMLVAAFVMPAFGAIWPIRDLADQRGFYAGIKRACEIAGPDSVVLDLDGRYSMALRAWCGASVGRVRDDSTHGIAVADLSAWVTTSCEQAVVVGASETDVTSSGLQRDEFELIVLQNDRHPRRTLVNPPVGYQSERLELWVAELGRPAGCDGA